MFVNRYMPDRETYQLFVKKIMLRKLTFGGIFLVLIAFVSAFLMRTEHPTIAAIEGFCGLLILVLMFYSPRQAVNQLMSIDKSLSQDGVRPETVITFTEDDIHLQEGKQDLHFAYDKIIRIFNIGQFGVLMTTKENGIMVDWSGFEVGSVDDFIPFILGKCQRVTQIEKR